MRDIPLTQGYVAIVDEADYDWLSKHKWQILRTKALLYAARTDRSTHPRRTILMHREILNPTLGMESDHINGDSLDNRRANLRSCTHAENLRNQRKQANRSSRYKGVSWQKSRCKWRAGIWVKGKQKYLGRFSDERDAALAYNAAAHEYFGEFARLNVL